MNAQRGFKNIVSSLLGQLVTIALGIVIPRLVLLNLGSEANGLMNSVNSFISYLSLLEAGVGAATLQALYHPIANQDRNSISRIMSATNHFYKRTGYIYFGIVILMAVIYSSSITTEISGIEVFIVVFVTGMSGVLSYWFQGKYRILLSAEGKDFILTNLMTIINVAVSVTKIVLMLLGFDLIALQIMYLSYNIVQIVAINHYIKKYYSWLDLHATPDFNAISQRNAAFVHQISTLVFSNTDSVILTLFCDLKSVSVYGMYVMLLSMVNNVILAVSGGISFAMGQAYQTNKNRYMMLHDIFEVYYLAFVFALYNIAYLFLVPFIKLYTTGINDVNYIVPFLSTLFMVFYILKAGRTSSLQVISYAGHFEETKWRSALEAVINLVVSLICVKSFGICGVVLGTIIALLYRTNDMIFYASHKLLNRSVMIVYKRWFVNILLFVVISICFKCFTLDLSSYSKIIAMAIISTIIVVPIYVLINSLVNMRVARNMVDFLLQHIGASKKRQVEVEQN